MEQQLVKPCPRCGRLTAYSLAVCPECELLQPPAAPAPAAVPAAPDVRKGNPWILPALIFAVLGIGWLLRGPSADDRAKEARKGAYYASQEFVERRLKAPLAAQFPDYREFMVSDSGAGTYAVRSYVDAPNSFGVKLRMNWSTRVQQVPNSENFRLLDIQIEER